MKTKDTELRRSPKTEALLGKIPRTLVAGGFVVLSLIILIVLLCMMLIKYPYGSGESIMMHILSEQKIF